MGTLANVKIEPMNVTWGESTAQVQTITCVADVADSLDGKYFYIFNQAGTKFHVWFNTSGGAAVDPAPGGSTAAVVTLTTGATASAVATATEAVIEALSGLDSTVDTATITVTQSTAGVVQAAFDVNSGFTFGVTTEGDAATDMGFCDGDIELSVEEDLADIVAQQSGSNVLSQIRTGKKVELTLTFKESSIAQIKRLLNLSGGGLFTPVGANATELAGHGQYGDFVQTLAKAKKLTLHPTVLGSSDKTRDYTFHHAYPMLDKIPFSGENIHQIPVSFKIYPKTSLNSRVQYYAFGDGSQTLT